MTGPHKPRNGFVHHEGLILTSVVLLSVAIMLPAVKHSMVLGSSGWLAILMGLGLVALFWLAFATVSTVLIQVMLWLETRQR